MRTATVVSKKKQAKPKAHKNKTLMLRINDQFTLQNLSNLEKHFMTSQSSKAIVKAVNNYADLNKRLEEMETMYYELKDKHNDLIEALERKASAEQDIKSLLTSANR